MNRTDEPTRPAWAGCLAVFAGVAAVVVSGVLIWRTIANPPCRMTLPDTYYDSADAAAVARIGGGVRPRPLPEGHAEILEVLIDEHVRMQQEERRDFLPESPFRERVVRAIKAARAMDAPRCAWRWESVVRVLARFGSNIPIVVPDVAERQRYVHVPMAYSLDPPMLMANPEAATNLSDEQLVSIVAHEATHVVFQGLVEESSGYTTKQFLAARAMCGKFDQQITHLHEALATWNELRTCAGLAESPSARHAFGEDLRAIAAFDENDPEPFARVMIKNLRVRINLFGIGNGAVAFCVNPPILRGPFRGHAFVPSMIDDSLVRAFSLSTRILGKSL